MNGKERAPSRGRISVLGRPLTSSAHRFSLPSFYFLLCTFFSSSCTSPTPPPPPPPPGADTTSHDFIWHLDTLGDGNSSVVYDVAIINDTTVWAVGEIFLEDSTGVINPTAYGLAKWNGRSWSYERLPAIAPQGYTSNLLPRGLFALSKDEIWFASGGVHRLKNGTINSYWINSFPGNPAPIWTDGQLAQRLWGSSSTNMYAVGTLGAIAHFNGATWQRIESGTNLHIYDIWGVVTSNGAIEVQAVGAMRFQGFDNAILNIDGGTVTIESDSNVTESLRGVWFEAGERYFVVGSGIFWKNSAADPAWRGGSRIWTDHYSEAVRGTRWNNVFVVGDFGDVLHFNGSTWHTYHQLASASGVFLSVAVTERLVVTVGYDGVVAIGRPILKR